MIENCEILEVAWASATHTKHLYKAFFRDFLCFLVIPIKNVSSNVAFTWTAEHKLEVGFNWMCPL